jgi:type II secretory pathway predicted ATPase ExeA
MVCDLLAMFGLIHNPFGRGIPREALWHPPGSEAFFHRVEGVALDGGFVMLGGEPGLGKSKILQLLSDRLLQVGGDLVVGVMERPQSSVCDFYRELGDVFGVELSPSNRYGGFKALREKWRYHIQATLLRPILLVDEAQEVAEHCLTELRLLSNAKFDSEVLLTTVLCGDNRLPQRFRKPALLPLGSRVRTRWLLEPWDRKVLHDFLEHALDAAGAPHLMTDGLKTAVVEHSGGNLRMLCNMGDELLNAGYQRKVKQLDEQLYVDVFDRKPVARARRSRDPER